MSVQLQAALERALLVSVPAGAIALLTAMQRGASWHDALILCGLAFFGPLVIRGVGEGVYDAWRQKQGLVRPADVQIRR